MTNEELFSIIAKDKNLRKHVYPDSWFSGSTEVYPYTFWDYRPDNPSIEIQLDSSYVYRKKRYDYRFYKKFERQIVKAIEPYLAQYQDRIKWWSLDANDGSCPPTLKFALYPDGACRHGIGLEL